MQMSNQGISNLKTIAIAIFAAALGLAPIYPGVAQNAKPDHTQQAVGAAMIAHVKAHIVGIDTASNSVLLRGPRGNVVEVDVDPAVANVANLKIGDTVEIAYKNALLVHADKVAPNGIRERIETDATTPASGGASTSVRSVQVVATVQKIDRKQRLITLRGPERTQTFQVSPDIALEKLKVGDSVRAEFVSATAVQVTRDGSPIK
jgi:Cu/Ag efflux protein CusF